MNAPAPFISQVGQIVESDLQYMSRMYVRIAESARQMKEVTERTEAIAEQTNLLALNAAIESTRAGDYGRSSCLAAKEVRSLSTRASEATGNPKSDWYAEQVVDRTGLQALGAIEHFAISVASVGGLMTQAAAHKPGAKRRAQ